MLHLSLWAGGDAEKLVCLRSKRPVSLEGSDGVGGRWDHRGEYQLGEEFRSSLPEGSTEDA